MSDNVPTQREEITSPGTISIQSAGHEGKEIVLQSLITGIAKSDENLMENMHDTTLENTSATHNPATGQITVTSTDLAFLNALNNLTNSFEVKTFNHGKSGPTSVKRIHIIKIRFKAAQSGAAALLAAQSAQQTTLEGWCSGLKGFNAFFSAETTETTRVALTANLERHRMVLIDLRPKAGAYGMAATECTFKISTTDATPPFHLIRWPSITAFSADAHGNTSQALQLKFTKPSLDKLRFTCYKCMVHSADDCHCISKRAPNKNRGDFRPRREGYANVPNEIRNTPQGHFAAFKAAIAPPAASVPSSSRHAPNLRATPDALEQPSPQRQRPNPEEQNMEL